MKECKKMKNLIRFLKIQKKLPIFIFALFHLHQVNKQVDKKRCRSSSHPLSPLKRSAQTATKYGGTKLNAQRKY
jgi:hypothetical protein